MAARDFERFQRDAQLSSRRIAIGRRGGPRARLLSLVRQLGHDARELARRSAADDAERCQRGGRELPEGHDRARLGLAE